VLYHGTSDLNETSSRLRLRPRLWFLSSRRLETKILSSRTTSLPGTWALPWWCCHYIECPLPLPFTFRSDVLEYHFTLSNSALFEWLWHWLSSHVATARAEASSKAKHSVHLRPISQTKTSTCTNISSITAARVVSSNVLVENSSMSRSITWLKSGGFTMRRDMACRTSTTASVSCNWFCNAISYK